MKLKRPAAKVQRSAPGTNKARRSKKQRTDAAPSDYTAEPSFAWGIHTVRVTALGRLLGEAASRDGGQSYARYRDVVLASGKRIRLVQRYDRVHIECDAAHVFDTDDWSLLGVLATLLAIKRLWEEVRIYVRTTDAYSDLQVSRLDIGREFLIPGGMPYVPRAPKRSRWAEYGPSATDTRSFQAAYGKAGRMRFYDKEREQRYGPAKEQAKGVWRYEATIRRVPLKRLGIDTVADLTVATVENAFLNQWATSRLGEPVPCEPWLQLQQRDPKQCVAMIESLRAVNRSLGFATASAQQTLAAFEERNGGAQYRLDLESGTLDTSRVPDELIRRPRRCKVDGCARSHKAYGRCGTHYRQWIRAGRPGD